MTPINHAIIDVTEQCEACEDCFDVRDMRLATDNSTGEELKICWMCAKDFEVYGNEFTIEPYKPE